MNEVQYINAGNHIYASEFMKNLPENALLNKVAVGAGITSVALRSAEKMVVCVPFVSLIINKLEWCRKEDIQAIGVYQNGATEEEIRAFGGNIILVTWDSLPKVANIINPTEWRLTIDESHKLIDSAAFRTEAIMGVLDNFRKFKAFCFVTATPVDDEFQLSELKQIPKYQIKWSRLEPVTVNYVPLERGTLHKTLAVVALSHLQGESRGNAHIFINSVKGIIEVVKLLKEALKLSASDVRIVCADNEQNKTLLSKRLGIKFIREENTSPLKKINFYTSTSFEGSDIYDRNGVSYVATDGTIDHTKINILTTLPQIAGRIRDSRYKNEITLFYTPNTYYSHTTEQEFKESVQANLNKNQKVVEDYSRVSDETKAELRKSAIDNPYLIVYKNELKLNEAVMLNEMYNYRTIHKTYYITPGATLKTGKKTHNDIEYRYTPKSAPSITGLNKLNFGEKPNFQEVCQEYITLTSAPYSIGIETIEREYPLIKQAYEILGAAKMKALEYRKIELEKELINANKQRGNSWKVSELLKYRIGEWISLEKAKKDLQSIYETLNIPISATATHIKKYYEVKEHKKRIDNKTVKGYKIINKKIKH